MSTKIYDGLISTTSDVFELNRKIRQVLEPVFLGKFYNIYETVNSLPNDASWSDTGGLFYGADEIDKNDYVLYEKILKLHKTSMHTFSGADIMYDVLIIENFGNGNPLVMVFGEKSQEYIELLKTAGVVEEYGYWDNSDPDETVSDEEWETRKNAWKTLDDKAPSEVGLLVSSPLRLQSLIHIQTEEYGHLDMYF